MSERHSYEEIDTRCPLLAALWGAKKDPTNSLYREKIIELTEKYGEELFGLTGELWQVREFYEVMPLDIFKNRDMNSIIGLIIAATFIGYEFGDALDQENIDRITTKIVASTYEMYKPENLTKALEWVKGKVHSGCFFKYVHNMKNGNNNSLTLPGNSSGYADAVDQFLKGNITPED